MNDDKITNQDISSANSADEAQKTLADGEHYSGGSAMLEARIEASNNPDDPSDKLAVTNLSSNTDPDDPSDETNPEIAVQNNNLDLERSQDSQPLHRE